MKQKTDLTPAEAEMLHRIVEGGGPRPVREDSVALVGLLNRGLIDARKVFTANPSGVAALQERPR